MSPLTAARSMAFLSLAVVLLALRGLGVGRAEVAAARAALTAALSHASWLLSSPAVVLSTLVVWGAVGIVAGSIAHQLRWGAFRTTMSLLAAAGLAVAVSVTLLERLRFGPPGPLYVRSCEAGSTLLATDVDAVLNWLPLVPLGFFLALASRRPMLTAVTVAGVAVGIEATQAVTGLGACQESDVIRNAAGGLAAVAGAVAVSVAGSIVMTVPETGER